MAGWDLRSVPHSLLQLLEEVIDKDQLAAFRRHIPKHHESPVSTTIFPLGSSTTIP